MNDLTRRLNAKDDDRALHPDDYRVILECSSCKGETYVETPKSEVDKFRQSNGGSNVMSRGQCAKCAPDLDEVLAKRQNYWPSRKTNADSFDENADELKFEANDRSVFD